MSPVKMKGSEFSIGASDYFFLQSYGGDSGMANILFSVSPWSEHALFWLLICLTWMWWKHDAGFCKSRFCSQPRLLLGNLKGKISSSNGAVFFGMPLLKQPTYDNDSNYLTASMSVSWEHLKGKPFESNRLCVSSLSEHVSTNPRVKELKIVFQHW